MKVLKTQLMQIENNQMSNNGSQTEDNKNNGQPDILLELDSTASHHPFPRALTYTKPQNNTKIN